MSTEILDDIEDKIEDKNQFISILNSNPGVVIIKFGADWCNPCKLIHDHVHDWFNRMPDNVVCYDLDTDDNFEIFAFLKKNKQVSSLPVILGYKKGNTMVGADYSVVGADKKNIDTFFNEVLGK
jgi:thiol-disulfide isomerase/thioredoxin